MAKKSPYEKDKVLCKYYFDLENNNALYESSDDNSTPKTKSSNIPFYTIFVEQWKDIDRLSALYSIKAPFELLHADIADIRFFFKICSPSKILSNASGRVHVENVHLHNEKQASVGSKMNLFYRDIDPSRQKINNDGRMRL